MTLFDDAARLHEAARIDWTPEEAVIGVLLTAMRADTCVTTDETELLHRTLQKMRLYRRLGPVPLSQLVSSVLARQEGYPRAAAMTSVARAVPVALRSTVFALATDMVLTDGEVGSAEKQYLDALLAALDLDPDEARQIIDVLIVKNSG